MELVCSLGELGFLVGNDSLQLFDFAPQSIRRRRGVRVSLGKVILETLDERFSFSQCDFKLLAFELQSLDLLGSIGQLFFKSAQAFSEARVIIVECPNLVLQLLPLELDLLLYNFPF